MGKFVQRFLLVIVLIIVVNSLKAQFVFNSDSAFKASSPGSGRLWGYAFGDYYYKAHSDSLNRGGSNQYTGIPQGRNELQFRRVYLGYDYNISKKFSAELLLAAEDNFPAYNPPSSNAASGDLTSNGKETFYIKLANIRWKNIWKGTDLVVGEQFDGSFSMLTEKVWNYRSIERTVSDIRRTPSFDVGVGLQGVFDSATRNFGYDILVGNGSGDKPDAASFKWFYGDVWAMFLDKRLIFDLYADYQRLNWSSVWHHDRQMTKAFIAWNTPIFTLGVEGYINNIRQDTKATLINPVAGQTADTINTNARGIAFYMHGDILPGKLRWFARIDTYNPNHDLNNNLYSGYAPLSSPAGYGTGSYRMTYNNSGGVASATPVLPGQASSAAAANGVGDITSKEVFATVGLDYMPFPNVHFEPNIWYNHYASQLPAGKFGDYDMVYRITFFYVFGKKYKNTYNQF